MKVRVEAGAKRELVQRLGTGFILSVKEPAERNLANTRARELLARELRVPLAAVRLIAGQRRPQKTFEILGLAG